jgi:hypothetical protein
MLLTRRLLDSILAGAAVRRKPKAMSVGPAKVASTEDAAKTGCEPTLLRMTFVRTAPVIVVQLVGRHVSSFAVSVGGLVVMSESRTIVWLSFDFSQFSI